MTKIVFFLTLAVLQLTVAGYDAGIGRQAFFSGTEYTVTLKLDRRFFGKGETPELNWNLTGRGTPLGSGVITPENQKISFKVNELRPGIVVPAVLKFNTHGHGRGVMMSFFSPDPFSDLRRLQRIKIGLYPADSPLAALLDRYKLPYEKVSSLDEFHGRILFISGADFTADPKLLEPLARRLQRGMKVVVLPPVKGELKFPASMFTRNTLLPRKGIRELRREFDILPLAFNINMKSDGDTLALKFSEKGRGSGGIMLDTGRGELIFSGWSLSDAENPTGIYLLRHYISPDPQ